MSLKLELRQRQSLVMTQSLRQSIELLQMSMLELTEFVGQELEKNPLLSEVDNENADSENIEVPESAEPANNLDNEDIFWGEGDNELYNNNGKHEKKSASDVVSSSDYLESVLAEPPSLRQHLIEQLQVDIELNKNPADFLIAVHLVDMLDERGYLREDINYLSAQLGAPLESVENSLQRVQDCDPAGVAARSLAECLRLQAQDKGLLTPALAILLDNLNLLESGDKNALGKLCGVSAEKLERLLHLLRSLDPAPGANFSTENVQTLIPDVWVRKQGKTWRVELNPESLPRLLVNHSSYALLLSKARGAEEKQFLREQLANASWLVKALHQRAETLLKVANVIVQLQEKFFEYGVGQLRPLTMKEVAEKAGIHESTVSRVSMGKWFASPRGNLELRYFFASATGKSSGEVGTSSQIVMHRIKSLIAAEEKTAPLTDDALVNLLADEGIEVARRTVVKYRTKLRIGSSRERAKGL